MSGRTRKDWHRVTPPDFARQLDVLWSHIRRAGLDSPNNVAFNLMGRVDVQVDNPQQTALWASHLNLPTPQLEPGLIGPVDDPWRSFRSGGFVDGVDVRVWCSVRTSGGGS